MNNAPSGLLKQDSPSQSIGQTSRKFVANKRKVSGICRSLSKPTNEYDPVITIKSIKSYIEGLDRILYSEISNYVFSLGITERGIFVTNIEKLLHYVLEDDGEGVESYRKIVIKMYDHTQLVIYQAEAIKDIFASGIEEAKQNLNKEVKGIEKEYITILGIFASIVFAFIGGLTFSSSVLQNISSASIYRVILIVDLLAFVFLNIIYLLIRFICTINEKDSGLFSIRWINIVCLVVAIITIGAWLLNAHSISAFITQFLPWR